MCLSHDTYDMSNWFSYAGGGTGPTLADAGRIAKSGRGAPLSSYIMTSSYSVNRVTIVVERRYPMQH